MPKAMDRSKHFDQLSNEDLVKYIKGSPISIVSGKSLKFGSYEHRYQMAAIRKIMMKRRVSMQLDGSRVAFSDYESKTLKKHDVQASPLHNSAATLSTVRRHPTAVARHVPSLLTRDIAATAQIPVQNAYLDIPQSAIITSETHNNSGIPDHLLNHKLPNKSSFY
jgi:hypothetical protein